MYEPVLTLAERLAVIRAQEAADREVSATAALPIRDAMYHPKDWPVDSRVWFYRAGINNDNIADLGAFWSPRMRRLVVPYTTLSGEEAWIARDPYWSKGEDKLSGRPKYLFPQGVSRGGGAVFHRDPRNTPPGIVIVEDVLSAYRIARDTDLAAVAAQGTTLDYAALTRIAQVSTEHSTPVYVWLDNDRDGLVNYGQQAAAALRTRLGNMGVTATNVVTYRDPKLLEPSELRAALEV